LPQWLREELGYQDADFQVHLDRGGCLSRRSRGSKRYLA
jgi:hypothetical protein